MPPSTDSACTVGMPMGLEVFPQHVGDHGDRPGDVLVRLASAINGY
jgi:hypothetical protein